MKNLISLSSKSINKNTVARYLILQMEKKKMKKEKERRRAEFCFGLKVTNNIVV